MYIFLKTISIFIISVIYVFYSTVLFFFFPFNVDR